MVKGRVDFLLVFRLKCGHCMLSNGMKFIRITPKSISGYIMGSLNLAIEIPNGTHKQSGYILIEHVSIFKNIFKMSMGSNWNPKLCRLNLFYKIQTRIQNVNFISFWVPLGTHGQTW